ncbi:MAG: methionine adenosyltransferase [Deltaproteobacteria bacterium]|nr:methionine adenosyltransferase [Deltaproteobacteria bacterium]
MYNVLVKAIKHIALDEQPLEVCERKGLGHPDTICDSIMNQASIELSKEYLKRFGEVLHHNLDKGLISAGGSQVAFGGGEMTSPILIVYGDRATYDVGSEHIPVDEITIKSTQNWFKEHLRFINPDEHLKHQVVIKPGSSSLQDIFARKGKYLGANDTSAAVGFAPYSRTERTILDLEHYLNSKDFKKSYPESGEDVKIMGFRNENKLDLTVAMAFVDRYIESEADYFRKKGEIYNNINEFLKSNYDWEQTNVGFNMLDVKGRGLGGLYLTVLGTSVDTGDSGQVGRGNNVVGVIPLNRPISAEAAAGKNPTSHVGKIYNLLSYKIANEIYCCTEGIKEAYFWLVSAIGQPIDQPAVCNVQLILEDGVQIKDVSSEVENAIAHEFEHLDEYCMDLATGKVNLV